MYLCFSKIGILLPLFFHPFFLTVSGGEVRAHSSLHPRGPQGGVWEWEQFVQDASNMEALPDENFKTTINRIQVRLFIITLHQAQTILSHADDKRTLPVLLRTSHPTPSVPQCSKEGRNPQSIVPIMMDIQDFFSVWCFQQYRRKYQCANLFIQGQEQTC